MLVGVPESRPQNGFTRLFEACAAVLIERKIIINKIVRQSYEYFHGIWEGVYSKRQPVKRSARGYRPAKCFVILGKARCHYVLLFS